MPRFLLPAAVAGAMLLAAVPATALPTGWTTASRAYATHATVAHDLAVEPDGTTHIAVEGGASVGIWYVTRVGSTWQKLQVSTGDDHSPSIALDGIGVVIAFARMNAGDRGIFTVTNVTGDWVTTKRHTGEDTDPSLGVYEGRAHLAFRTGNTLRYAAGLDDFEDGWIAEVVDASCCTSPPTLGLTSGGDARVAFSDGTAASPGGLIVASRTGAGSWGRQVVDSHRTSTPALAVYGTGLYLAYVRRGAGTWYASKPGSQSWTLKQLDASASGAPDISAFSGSAAFIFGGTGKLRYATMSGGILLTKVFTTTSGDRRPHITRAGGKPVITWLRSNGGSGDGVLMTRQK